MSQSHIGDNSFNTTNSFNTNTTFSNSTNCGNTDNSTHNVWNYTIADEDERILDWLSLLNPQTRHNDIRTRRVDGVGDWLLKTEEYQNWLGGSDRSALLCYGGPGAGKSYIR